MTESFASAIRGRWRPGVRFFFRTGRRTLAESLYLLTAPFIAAAGLALVLAGLCVATAGLFLPGGSPVVAAGLAPARWLAALERWRIARLRRTAAWPDEPQRQVARPREPRPRGKAAVTDPVLLLDVAHAAAMLPVALITAVITGLWWFIGLGAATSIPRSAGTPAGPLRPMTLDLGSAQTHIDISLGLASPIGRHVFGTVVGLLLLLSLPLVTRACTAVQAGLGQTLLSDASALYRRISGLERERDTARAQTVAAVTAEAAAMRRLERDIHDGPQQRLVLLGMELGRAQRHLDSDPEAVRASLADAIAQAQEALDELRALSRGIAPPILADRGLGEAITALAARSAIPVELDADALTRRPDPALETAAYFVIAEALTNVAKHSHARRCAVGLRHGEGTLRVWVTDDGVGGAALAKGHGLRGLDDRVLAAGGRLRVASPRGGPTTITAELPWT